MKKTGLFLVLGFLSFALFGCATANIVQMPVDVKSAATEEEAGGPTAANKAEEDERKIDMDYVEKSTGTADVIAVISINGEIGDGGREGNTLPDKMKVCFKAAAEDVNVKAVILRVDSPGGGVNASDLIWNEVMKFKKSKKPLVAFFDGLAASGGYYVSVPADKIVATPETITGSIGVIVHQLNYSGLLDKIGLKDGTIKSGKHKDMMSPTKPPNKEDDAIVQALVNEAYDHFVQKVAAGRHMKEAQVRVLADGRIYTARQAAKNGLIDSTGYIEDAFALAKKLAKVKKASLVRISKKSSGGFSFFFGETQNRPLIDLKDYFPFLKRAPGLYYLWEID